MQLLYQIRKNFIAQKLIKNKFIKGLIIGLLRSLNLIAENGIKVAKINSYSMEVDLSEPIQRAMYQDLYEPLQTKWFNLLLEEGDLVFDIGASFGYYTTLSSKIVGENGRVIAFEPSLRASSTIYRTIQINHIKNIEVYQYAIGECKGLIEIQIPPNSFESHSPSILKTPWQNDDWRSTLVPVISLDEFYSNFINGKKIKLIKIDVEGFEPQVIRGLSALAKNKLIENIICEFNSGWLERNGSSHKELFDLIVSYGFKVHRSTKLLKAYESKAGQFHTLQDFWFQKIN